MIRIYVPTGCVKGCFGAGFVGTRRMMALGANSQDGQDAFGGWVRLDRLGRLCGMVAPAVKFGVGGASEGIMLKAERDSLISGLTDVDRRDLRRVVAAIKDARGGSPDTPANTGRITARELLDGWQEELPSDVRAALEAIVIRDETGPSLGEDAPDFSLKRLGSEERVRLSDYRGRRPVALAFGSYT